MPAAQKQDMAPKASSPTTSQSRPETAAAAAMAIPTKVT